MDNGMKETMKRVCVGLLAHVDAGKTTLSEALLYRGGCLRTLGRVDHQDAFLDTETLERERGITIFSKQAVLPLENVELQLLDTPGHADFSAEMERTLQILDCAVLVVSGTDGLQSHTRTLWRLLERYGIPAFIFVNKMDLPGADRAALLRELRERLSGGCVDFGEETKAVWENAALCGEEALTAYLETGALSDKTLAELVGARKLFPCFFGSALRLEGVDALLDGLKRYAPRPSYPSAFGARVYKIARDPQGVRLTFLKVTGGVLRVKALLTNRHPGVPEEDVWEEKADQLRIYSGAKFHPAEEAGAGTVCAVAGLSRTRPGEGLGGETSAPAPVLEPVLSYRVELPEGCDPGGALSRLRQLEEEDPMLRVVWNDRLREIHLQLMGEVQLEILRRLILDRFGLAVEFGAGGIVYRETITAPALGAGHFEPLRHYAEVRLLLEPGPGGSGLVFAAACPEEELSWDWQRLILSQLRASPPPGILTGSPLTDLKITLVGGRAHEKHTEGGDFRQAACRAVRQGLAGAENVLLEPWYDFHLELPAGCLGRAMTDLQRMGGETDPCQPAGEEAVLTGCGPAAGLRNYAAEVAAYTHGQGRLSCSLRGYEPCADQAAAAAAVGYDWRRDTDYPADSVFCAHGTGFTVPWDQVWGYLHTASAPRVEAGEPERTVSGPRAAYTGTAEQDAELMAIFERTYGPVKRREFRPRETARPEAPAPAADAPPAGPEYLLVDGYNIIFAWDELKRVAADNLDAARKQLLDLLCNYQGFRKCVVIVVFDAYRVPGNPGEATRYHNLHVVYTKESQTADAYIEKATYEIGRGHRVRVATSDGAEQLIIWGHGALRVSASAFHEEVTQVGGQIAAILDRNNRPESRQPVRAAMDRALLENAQRREDPEPPEGKTVKKR